MLSSSPLPWDEAPSAAVGPVEGDPPVLAGVVTHDPRQGPLFPWWPRWRWRKQALARYRAWQRVVRRARWAARLARLALSGVVIMAMIVDWFTRAQLTCHLGALPALYGLLEILQVRQIINRCAHGRPGGSRHGGPGPDPQHSHPDFSHGLTTCWADEAESHLRCQKTPIHRYRCPMHITG